MKLILLLLTAACLQFPAKGLAQRITLKGKALTAKQVFNAIEKQTGYLVFANKKDMAAFKPVSVDAHNMLLKDLLDLVFKDQPLGYLITDKTIVLMPKGGRRLEEPDEPDASSIIAVQGLVQDSAGQVLGGASVRIKGGYGGTVTDVNGAFQLKAAPEDTLVVSFVGYATQDVKAARQQIITLMPTGSMLDELQVTAYGTTTRRLSTGAISTVSGEEIAKNPVTNALSALRGRVAGMFVQQYSGQPGNAIGVTIRGRSSLLNNPGSGTPLFVVDGVPIPNGQLPLSYPSASSPGNPGQILKGGSILDYLPASLIERVDVLTDADATAIYGSRGGYGVILITTKKGKPGQPQLNIDVQTGISVRGPLPEQLSLEEYLLIRREAFKNDNATPGPGDYDVNGTWQQDRATNWLRELSGHAAPITLLNATYGGGNGNVHYLIGANYNQEHSIQRNTGASQTGALFFNFNTTADNRKVYASLSGSYSSTLNDQLGIDYSNTTDRPPNALPIFLPDGNLNWEAGSTTSSFAAFKMINKNQTNNLTFTSEFRYTPVKGLTFRALTGFNTLNSRQNIAYPSTYFDPATNYVTSAVLNLVTSRVWNIDPHVSYDLALGREGRLTATAGMTVVDRLVYNQLTQGTNLLSDDLLLNPTFAGAGNQSTFYSQMPGRNLSYFGIVHYDWAHKYILNLNGRYDGSTRFAPQYRYGQFGSVGAAWIISRENWFSGLGRVISFAKLRGSFGITGGDGIPEYLYLNTFGNGAPYNGGAFLATSAIANPALRWEKILKRDLELNLEFFKGRLGLIATWYRNKSNNQLTAQSMASTTGVTGMVINAADAVITNTGIELALTSTPVRRKHFTCKNNFVLSVNKNVLQQYPFFNAPLNINYEVGKSIQGIKVFSYAGVDPATGYYLFYKNGVKGLWNLFDRPLDEAKDRTVFVDLAPQYFGSFQNELSWKSLTVSFVIGFTSRMGRTLLGLQTFPGGMLAMSQSREVLKRWQKPGDAAPVQKVSQTAIALLQQANYVQSNAAYSDATYARLNNVYISYTLPPALFPQRVGKLSLFLSGQNLLTVTGYKDLDPENLGVSVAPLRTVTAGLHITL
jgi:TonB-linked SusC/RagA family outer membrane protein